MTSSTVFATRVRTVLALLGIGNATVSWRKVLSAGGGILMLTGALWWTPEPAQAASGDLSSFNSRYGTASTRLNSCSLCHTAAPAVNPYGAAYKAAGRNPQAFVTIEPLDSDGDGWTNLAEILARFFPGNAADEPLAGVAVSPSTAAKTGATGSAVSYALQATNTGGATDTFDVTVSGNSWVTTVSASSLSIAASASAALTVTVSIPPSAADGARDSAIVRLTSRGNPAVFTTATLTTIARKLGSGSWGERHSVTSQGMVLMLGDVGGGSDVLFYNGTQVVTVQKKDLITAPGNVDLIVFALGNGASPGRVVGAWRRGTDDAWVWLNDGSQPKKVQATNPINPALPLNPEAVAVADGCVLMALQAFFGGNAVKHIFRIDPVTGLATNLTGTAPVPGLVERIVTSGCQAAWLFDPGGIPVELHFYDGTTVRVIDRDVGQPHLNRGRLVYAKQVTGVRQIFLYDSTAVSPAPVQLTFDSDPTKMNFFPRTDGRHVAWLRGNLDATDSNIVLNGGVPLTGGETRPDLAAQREHPFQLQRGQLIWEDVMGVLRYADGSGVGGVDIAPARTVSAPWLADGFIVYQTELGLFLLSGTPPADAAQPPPPLLVVATQGPGAGEVRVAWDQILGASSYNLYTAQQAGLTKDNYLTLPGGRKISGVTSPYTLTGLEDGRTHYFVVTAVEGGVEGPSSREARVTLVGQPIWVPVGGFFNLVFSAVATDRADGSLAYAGGSGNGRNCADAPKVAGCDVYKSTDGGSTWTPVTGAINRIDARALAVDGPNVYAATRDFFAGVPSKILRSRDGGATWQEVVPDGGQIGELNKSLAIDPITPITLYAGDFRLPTKTVADSFVIKSTDGGTTWFHLPEASEPVGAEIRAYAIAIDPLTSGKLFAAGTGTPNLVKSLDGGLTWINVSPTAGFVYSLAVDRSQPTTLYAGVADVTQISKGVYRSPNGGGVWTPKTAGFPMPPPRINVLLVDPANPAYLHAGTDAGYFYSTDSGETWVQHNTGLTGAGQFINALAMTASRHLIAATSDGLFLLNLAPVFPPVTVTLTVTKAGTGSGAVTSNPPGIDCGVDCLEAYAIGTLVTLTATPAVGSAFAGWSGACTGIGPCVVSMTVDQSVTATFVRDLPQLSLSLNGTSFQPGSIMILTATVTPGATPRTVDVYLAVRLPDGTLLFYPSLTPALQPVLTNWTVAPFTGEVFRYTFTGGEPAGNYTWLAAFTEPGTLNIIGGIVQAPFSFSPGVPGY